MLSENVKTLLLIDEIIKSSTLNHISLYHEMTPLHLFDQ
jgi:hypothetical protein